MGKPLMDETGNTYGRLRVIRREGSVRGYATWMCTCECGGALVVSGYHLRSGRVKSCGCKKLENLQLGTLHAQRHGMYATPTYASWQAAKERVSQRERYKNYVGITMCDEWSADFLTFLRDMGERPPGTSLDRVDNSKGYYPANCRWATPAEQTANRRVTLFVTVEGATLPLASACRLHGISRNAVWLRARKKSIPIQDSFEYFRRKKNA